MAARRRDTSAEARHHGADAEPGPLGGAARHGEAPVAVVTGSNTGIGKHTVIGLCSKGYHCVMACRSEARATEAMAAIREACATAGAAASLEFLQLDVSSMADVRRAAKQLLERHTRIHVLVNNA